MERSEVRSGIQEKGIISKISGLPDEPESLNSSRPATRVLVGMTLSIAGLIWLVSRRGYVYGKNSD